VKLFECDNCGQMLFFENTSCVNCQHSLGYCFEKAKLVVLPDAAQDPTVPFRISLGGGKEYLKCKNYVEHGACNWLVLATSKSGLCRSCELSEVIPDLSDPANLAAWIEIERAKRRLLYTLAALRLRFASRLELPEGGLAFRFLRGSEVAPVMTGHQDGVITLNIAEANASFRENMREKLDEAYRTVLGHLRHESGHYYWDRLLRNGDGLEGFRALFGDERADYAAAVERHYAEGAPANWHESYISAYATMHPWEDWAETWAHYLHMRDTLETAKCFGMTVRVPGKSGLARVATQALALGDFEGLASGWQAVTLTLNSLSRSMGVKDVYPFVVSAPVQAKLRFIHDLVQPARESRRAPKEAGASAA
jgi:hypothetical protein